MFVHIAPKYFTAETKSNWRNPLYNQTNLRNSNLDLGGFQLLDLIITELKSHMTCYNLMPLIGWNNSIQTGEQIFFWKFPPMRDLEFLTDHVTFKLRYFQI